MTNYNRGGLSQFIPGFRSGVPWKKVISSAYYIFAFSRIFTNGLLFSILAFSIPFIIFYLEDLAKNGNNPNYNKLKNKILAVASILFILSLLFLPGGYEDLNIGADDAIARLKKGSIEGKDKVSTLLEKLGPKEGKNSNEITKNTSNQISNTIKSGTPSSITFSGSQIDQLAVHFIDVGQGECILIGLPNQNYALIDTGPSLNSEKIIDYIENLNIHQIEHLIVTNNSEEHIGGLKDILDNFNIQKIYLPNIKRDDFFKDKATIDLIDKLDIEIINASPKLRIVNSNDLIFEIIGPIKKYSDIKNLSLVTRLRYKDVQFIFTSDAKKESEYDILENTPLNEDQDVLQSEVLSIGNHGDNSSTSMTFLSRVDPIMAIVSCGKNNHQGNPDSHLISTLENRGIKVYRTDIHGDILITTDGDNLITESKRDK